MLLTNPPSALVWHSTFAAPTGYSGSARAFVLGLDARGVAVRPLYLYGTDYDEQLLMGQLHPRIRALQAMPVHSMCLKSSMRRVIGLAKTVAATESASQCSK